MKKLFTTLRNANHTYHSFQHTARTLMHRSETALVAAVLLYSAATNLFFLPLVQQIWAWTLRFAPMHYLTNNNFSDIFTSPAILAGLVLIGLLIAFWTLYEFSVLLHGIDLVRKGEKIQFAPLLYHSLRDIRHAFLPQNWPILLYCAVLLPFTNFFLTSNYITQLAVPEYIMGAIRANMRYHAIYLAVCGLLLVICLFGALVLPLFVLERKSLWQAAKQSAAYVHKRFVSVFLLLFRWNVSVTVRALLRLLPIVVPLYLAILAIGLRSTRAMVALSRAMLRIELPFLSFLVDCVVTIAQCSILILLYYHEQKTLSFELGPRPNGRRYRTNGKSILAIFVAASTLLTLLLACIYVVLPEDDSLLSLLGGGTPIITSHRGYSTAAPENTLPAFQLAIQHGSDRAELDVQMTKDGVAMVTHDSSLRRCTGRNANIYDLTYDEVRKLDAGRWFSSAYAGTKIPTLEEVLNLCKGRIQLNIEIKPNAATPELEAETVRLIHKYGYTQDCVVTSQSYETLCKVKALDPEIRTGYILALGVGTYYDLEAADFFSVESTFITSGMVQQIHLRGKTVSAWTINQEKDARKMLSLGVDDIITDDPELIQSLLDEDTVMNNELIFLRDLLRDILSDASLPEETPADETAIEEAIENPEELLDAA